MKNPDGFMPKYEIALRYFPNANSKKAATNRLSMAIKRCQLLSQHLKAIGYNATNRCFSPRQIELIQEYLGEP